MKRMVAVMLSIVGMVTSQDMNTCIDTLVFHTHCCDMRVSDENIAILRECVRLVRDPRSCAFDICYGEKKGFVLANGTIDKSLLAETVQKNLENYTDIYDVVKNKCFIDDLGVAEDPCYLRELGHCLYFYSMLKCPNWIESDECTRVKAKIQNCEKLNSYY